MKFASLFFFDSFYIIFDQIKKSRDEIKQFFRGEKIKLWKYDLHL